MVSQLKENSNKYCYLVYFISRSFFLGTGTSLTIIYGGNDFLISVLIGAFVGLFISNILNKIYNSKYDDITDILNSMNFIGKIFAIIISLFSFLIIINILLNLCHLIAMMFLTKTSAWLILFPLIILPMYAISKGDKTIIKSSKLLFIISIILFSIAFFSLIFQIKIEYMFPIFRNNINNTLLGGVQFGVLSSIPNFFILSINKKENKCNLTKSYLFSLIFVIAPIFLTFFILGPNLTKLYTFPEYIVLRNISILNFVEKIENFISYIWILDVFFLSSLALNTINKCIRVITAYSKYISYIIMIVIYFVISFYLINNYIFPLILFRIIGIIMLLFFIIIIIPIYIFTKKH